jgi:hypothetical protein
MFGEGTGDWVPCARKTISGIRHPTCGKKLSTTILPFPINPINACKCEA